MPPANVCVIGGGIVGTNAAKIALGMGAKVTLIDLNLNRLRELDDIFNGRVFTLASNSYNVGRATREADLVIGGVLIPGAAAPKIVTDGHGREDEEGRGDRRRRHRPGRLHRDRAAHHAQRSVLRGERSRALLRDEYACGGAEYLDPGAHQCDLSLRDEDCNQLGAKQPSRLTTGLQEGVNTYDGILTCKPVAESQNKPWKPVLELVR